MNRPPNVRANLTMGAFMMRCFLPALEIFTHLIIGKFLVSQSFV